MPKIFAHRNRVSRTYFRLLAERAHPDNAPERGLQAASTLEWIVVNDLAYGLENGEAA